MTCQRCKGLMVEDRFFDCLDSNTRDHEAWRCVICGEVTDAIIMRNRSVQSQTNDALSAFDLSLLITEQNGFNQSGCHNRHLQGDRP